jgi:hypothetical protein
VSKHEGPTKEEEARNEVCTQTEEMDEISSSDSKGTEDEWPANRPRYGDFRDEMTYDELVECD